MFLSKIAIESHMTKHKNLGCLGCPSQYNDFKDYCSHANLCKPSWKEMVTSFTTYECFACKNSYKNRHDLVQHYNNCIDAIKLDVTRCRITEAEVKSHIIECNTQFIKAKNAQLPGTTLFIKVKKEDVVPNNIEIPTEDDTIEDVGTGMNIFPEKFQNISEIFKIFQNFQKKIPEAIL